MKKTVLPRLPEVDFAPLSEAKLEEMIGKAVATRQLGREATVIAMPRIWMLSGGAMALAASVMLAVVLAPHPTVNTASADVADFTDMLVLDSLDAQS